MTPSGTKRQLEEAIRKAVADAVPDGRIVRAGAEATRLASDYPLSGLSLNEIADAVIRAAAAAGLATEISRPSGIAPL